MVKAITYNVSWATQINVVAGTEQDFVERCQKVYSKGGLSCHNNAIKELKTLGKLDVAAFQEVNSDIEKKVLKVQPSLDSNKRGKIGLSTVLLMWDSNVFGRLVKSKVINLSNKNDDRPCLFVLTKKDNQYYLLINVHAPWNMNSKKLSTIISKNIGKLQNKLKIIMLGDFNDSNGNINRNHPIKIKTKRKVIRISNRQSKKKLKTSLKSCCWHKEKHEWGYFDSPGDYVMVSNNIKDIKLSIPKIYRKRGRNNRLFSDHMPVLAKIIL